MGIQIGSGCAGGRLQFEDAGSLTLEVAAVAVAKAIVAILSSSASRIEPKRGPEADKFAFVVDEEAEPTKAGQ
jgi:hypothetical protein